MKLRELVDVMNIADVRVASTTIRGLLPEQSLDMFHKDADPLLRQYGEREVDHITNVCKLALVVWIK